MTKKTYTIKLAADRTYQRLMEGLDGWHIDPKTYTANRETLTLITTNPNVVDVTVEEIHRSRYTITVDRMPAKTQQAAP